MGHSVSMEILGDAAAFLAACLPPSPDHTVPPPRPREMSVKELKEALREHGLAQKARGCTEKREFVQVLEDWYQELGVPFD
ncbi:hypothetical protein EON64_14820 [archaeon]|nr:MAG: hypothetical protein EON64_14820 [archaeon]